ncbi:hypothetical protein N656DRAFT_768835 [Canariomyces notabilis]|uniref:Uncharacterized protein n=1 Tax=Canariomyces notabilis TaxID=2074819 RepID=A0AAN6TD25_9PEZI|nr:hypothetical protein N656DRAFT_768835 [Canariomyces arenarius]
MAQASVVGVTAATATGLASGLASGPAAGPAVNGGSLLASLTSDEVRELREYQKLLRFRDEVVTGSHPRIKPTHLLGKPTQNLKQAPTPAAANSTAPATSQPKAPKGPVNSDGAVIDNFQAQQANQRVNVTSVVPGLGMLSSPSGGMKPPGAAKPSIDPVLLEKSDDLIKAEIQLKRQRLERDLREQIEQRRTASKPLDQLAELDVADIYAKALSLVHATPVQTTDDTAANASASSDSFDDNTFYSSRHDTPDSNMASRLPNESEDEEMREGSPYEPELDSEPVVQVDQVQPAAPPTQPVSLSAPSEQQPQLQSSVSASTQTAPVQEVMVPGLSIGVGGSARTHAQPPVPMASGALESNAAQDLARVNERLPNQAPAREPSPLVRAHDLSPLAPQPTHALPPAIARQPHLTTPGSGEPRATSAQVAALRNQPSNGSSPDSSSAQGNRPAEKKKNKKKKRKADRLAAETAAASPYIKPEPRSPSPLTSQFARPNKRQRRSEQQPLEVADDEPRYDQRAPAEGTYQERYQPVVVRQERVVGYERGDEYHLRRGEDPALVAPPRYETVYYDDYRAPPEPTGTQYIPEVRAVRAAPGHAEGPYDDGVTYYRDVRAASRMSVRPALVYPDRSQSPVMYERPAGAMPPPKRRVVVDAFGREYLEPVRATTVVREEAISDLRGPVSVPEHRYERILPPRAVSRRPDYRDDDGLLYRPASPAYVAPRRVVTQPEYAFPDHRGGYREPANSMLPPPPASEYHPSRPIPTEREPLPPREYLTRATSVRPAPPPAPAMMEPPSTRYESSASGYERPVPPRDYYAASGGAGPSIIRAVSARPAEGGLRYEQLPTAYEQPVLRDYAPPPLPPVALQPLRSASVRPAAETAVRYDYDYAAGPGAGGRGPYLRHDEGRRGEQQQAQAGGGGRGYTVPPPGEPQVLRREYHPSSQQGQGQPPTERYYARGREDEEVVYLDRATDVGGRYREMR